MSPWQMRKYMCYELLWKETRYSSIPEYSPPSHYGVFWMGWTTGVWKRWRLGPLKLQSDNCSQEGGSGFTGGCDCSLPQCSGFWPLKHYIWKVIEIKLCQIDHTERSCLNPSRPLCSCICHSVSNVPRGWGHWKGSPTRPSLFLDWLLASSKERALICLSPAERRRLPRPTDSKEPGRVPSCCSDDASQKEGEPPCGLWPPSLDGKQSTS